MGVKADRLQGGEQQQLGRSAGSGTEVANKKNRCGMGLCMGEEERRALIFGLGEG